MTLAFRKSYGNGNLNWRVVVHGWPYQFVTDDMAVGVLSDGRSRLGGLSIKGAVIGENSHLAEGLPDIDGMSVTILDKDNGTFRWPATEALTKHPHAVGTLNGSYDEADTVFTVNDTTDFVIGTRYHLGKEVLKVASKPGGSVLIMTRGEWDSSAQAHAQTVGAQRVDPEFTDRPEFMTGSRVEIYAHGPNEIELTDSGTLAWRGVVNSEPQDTGTGYRIRFDPLTKLFDQEISSDFEDPLNVIGVYYAWDSALQVQMRERSAAAFDSSIAATASVRLDGYFVDQGAFAEALQAAIDTATSGFTGSVFVLSEGASGWSIGFTTTGTPKYIDIDVSSTIDGKLSVAPVDSSETPVRVVGTGDYTYRWNPLSYMPPRPPRGYPDPRPRPAPFRGVPRAAYDRPNLVDAPRYIPDVPDDTNAPGFRIHLDKAHLLTVGDHVVNINGYPFQIAATTTTTGAVDLDDGAHPAVLGNHTRERPSVFTAVTYFGDGPTDLYGFITNLITKSTALAHVGGMPHLLASDFADWQAEVDAASQGRAYLTRRVYAFAAGTKLKDILEHELRIYGLYMYIDASAKLAVRRLRIPATTETSAESIDSDSTGAGASRSKSEFTPDGVINVVKIKTGWNREEEEHLGPTFETRHVRSISRLAKRRVLEVSPEIAVDGPGPSVDDMRALTDPVRSIYGGRYQVITLPVTWHHFDLLNGDTVTVSTKHMPLDGVRGMTDKIAQVVGQKWPLDAPMGSLKLMLSGLNVAGYAPTGRVASQSGSGTAWVVTLEANHYAPAGEVDASYFLAGDRIVLMQWDSSSPTKVIGIVDSVSGNDVTLTMDATWTPGSDTWNLDFGTLADITTSGNASQLEYAFCADSDQRLNGTSQAQVFAP